MRPVFSSATIVLAKVGAARLLAIAATSASWIAIARVNEGLKSASLICAKSGAWNGRVLSCANGPVAAAAAVPVFFAVRAVAVSVNAAPAIVIARKASV